MLVSPFSKWWYNIEGDADYSLEAAEKTARAFYKDVEFGRLATIK